jgi:hypothetical protein
LDREDDAGANGMCFSCARTRADVLWQLQSGSCKETLNQPIARGVTTFPTCRAVFREPDKERVRRLRQFKASWWRVQMVGTPKTRYTRSAASGPAPLTHGTGVV